jgi:hypothetical protein
VQPSAAQSARFGFAAVARQKGGRRVGANKAMLMRQPTFDVGDCGEKPDV